MSETPTSESFINRTIGNIQDLSRTWATQGLTKGKEAIETSADKLKATAAYLGDLSVRLNATEAATEAATEVETVEKAEEKAEDKAE